MPMHPAEGTSPSRILLLPDPMRAGLLTARVAGDGLMLGMLMAGGYMLKRHLEIDVFPGVDMLPDERIETVLHAMFGPLLQVLRAAGAPV